MKLIVGLGNPGRIYLDTRHNIGFAVIKYLAKDCKVVLKREKDGLSISGKAKFGKHQAILTLPLTYMNLSGIAVSALLKKYNIDLNDLLVVCDDLDLEFGRLKIKAGGSSGGHRGLKSIIDSLGSQLFNRLRLGIGRPGTSKDAATYVLSPFSKKEMTTLKEALKEAACCCKVWVTKGIAESTNIFNSRSRYNE